jgi:hypothetical protein
MWGFLFGIGALHSIMCLLIYSKSIHDKFWYLPLALLIALFNNFLWFYASKIIEDKKDIYIFSTFQSAILTLIYFLIPFIIFEIKLNKMELVGVFFVLLGCFILKMFQN